MRPPATDFAASANSSRNRRRSSLQASPAAPRRHRPRPRNRAALRSPPARRAGGRASLRACPESPPSMRDTACLRWFSVSASMRSPSPSTSVRSSLPFSKARRVNSPASASRIPGREVSSRSTARTTAGEPWRFSSAQSSPVKLCGPGIQATRPRSSLSAPGLISARISRRGTGKRPRICSSTGPDSGPERRIIATPEGRDPDESATIVSPMRISVCLNRDPRLRGDDNVPVAFA